MCPGPGCVAAIAQGTSIDTHIKPAIFTWMYLTCRRPSLVTVVLALIVLIQLYKYHFTATVHGRFVALESNGGRIGNQLFHLCSGYAISRAIGRRHYIRTLDIGVFHIAKHIQKIETIFPRLMGTFTVMEVGNEYRVPFAQKNGEMSCCEYEDPKRLENITEQFLVLELLYAQNVRYFEHMLPEIRYLLEFSDDVKRRGREVLDRWQIKDASAMCVHIRRSDFIRLHLATDFDRSVRHVRFIAKQQGLSKFVIFGDDVDFMRMMSEELGPTKTRFSSHSEGVDFFIASKACGAMLITAPTSTFGWWLAFFSPNQNAVFYTNDQRTMEDKNPNKDLFLSPWKPFGGGRR
ncbi:hypothetical protein Y032_0114g416 [Ancylostoma ceylanicum]|uniref:L-Fucosyltransferase n=1 Tax=Ancylostoma ceylanicum TaxID=53326 RepID=A0A016TD18_9BILA|nr:hypothetical protein Y032_0114g416 [Ancylostoma ceylanicum]